LTESLFHRREVEAGGPPPAFAKIEFSGVAQFMGTADYRLPLLGRRVERSVDLAQLLLGGLAGSVAGLLTT
jgi:hypothetical protein